DALARGEVRARVHDRDPEAREAGEPGQRAGEVDRAEDQQVRLGGGDGEEERASGQLAGGGLLPVEQLARDRGRLAARCRCGWGAATSKKSVRPASSRVADSSPSSSSRAPAVALPSSSGSPRLPSVWSAVTSSLAPSPSPATTVTTAPRRPERSRS